jgi:hypothetical protein
MIRPPYTYAAGRWAEERKQEEIIREGRQAGLTRTAKPVRLGSTNGLLASVGALLVSIGEKLRARHTLTSTVSGDRASQKRR